MEREATSKALRPRPRLEDTSDPFPFCVWRPPLKPFPLQGAQGLPGPPEAAPLEGGRGAPAATLRGAPPTLGSLLVHGARPGRRTCAETRQFRVNRV